MSRPTVVVVGLGPSNERLLTTETIERLGRDAPARLRTRHHPAAAPFSHVPSYDDLYESSADFASLYDAIVDDLVALAERSPTREVTYAVPGSGLVAERTVELLRARDDVDTVVRPAVSVIDVACAAMGVDPMAVQLRVVDALADGPLRGPGPLLVLQAYAPEVLAVFADRLHDDCDVVVLHHLGLDDEVIAPTTAAALSQFPADHLTSLWVPTFRSAGVALDDLVALTARLRRDCVWDQEQSHESLLPHLVEEAYEVVDAIDDYVQDPDLDSEHVVEELGDLLFQIAFHAELGDEAGAFDFTSIIDRVHDKLVSRHPHVFGDVTVTDADDAARRWELLKRDEKRRASVTDGIARQLPALTLYAKLRRKGEAVGLEPPSAAANDDTWRTALDALRGDERDAALVDALEALAALALAREVDLEGALRQRANELRASIRAHEGLEDA